MFILNSYRFAAPPTSIYTAASFIFSLRELTSRSSSCIRVKRTSDNTEQDIGWSSGFLDTSSLLTFCGSSNGIVTRFYNQGYVGSFLEATVNNTIVTSGSLELLNGKACIDITGNSLKGFRTGICSTDSDLSDQGYGKNYSEVFVGQTTNGGRVIRGETSSGRMHFFDGRLFRHNSNSVSFSISEVHSAPVVMASCWSFSTEIIRLDYQGNDEGTQSGLNGDWSCNGFLYGFSDIKMQEHVIWDYNANDTSSSLLGDYADQSNNYWSVY